MKTAKNVLIDNVAVRRRIAGDHAIELTRAEKRRAVRVLHRDGLNDHEIAERLGFGHPAVQKTRRRIGLPANTQSGRNRYALDLGPVPRTPASHHGSDNHERKIA